MILYAIFVFLGFRMEISSDHKNLLDDIFYNHDGGNAAFSSLLPLYKRAKELNGEITLKIVKRYLQGQGPYLLHKRVQRRFKRRKLLVLFPGEIFCLDLVFFLRDKSPSNRQKSYLLSVTDAFSKMTWCRGLVTKRPSECVSAFKSILEECKIVPKYAFHDRGTEFLGKEFKNFCKQMNIIQYSSTTILKSFVAEQMNYHIQLQIEKRLSFQRNRTWTGVLQESVNTLNHTPLKSLNWMTPVEAFDPENTGRLQTFYLSKKVKHASSFKGRHKDELKVDQSVKIAIRDPFRQRGYKQRWSKEVYSVSKVLDNAVPTCYNVNGFGSRLFYREELNPVLATETQLSSTFTSKKILRIIKDQRFPTKFLRSGKAIEFQKKFLVLTNEIDNEKRFMTESEILQFDNGSAMLRAYLEKKNGS